MPLPCVQPRSWGCLPEAFLPGRKKHLLSLKTIALAIPLAQKTGLSTIDEVISTSPHYQSVPDFQRVQITGDYASGVGISWPFNFPMRLPPHLVLACSLSSAHCHRHPCKMCGDSLCFPALCMSYKHLMMFLLYPLQDSELNALTGVSGSAVYFPWDSLYMEGEGDAHSVAHSCVCLRPVHTMTEVARGPLDVQPLHSHLEWVGQHC